MNDAWLAGLFEGEGSVWITYRKDGTPRVHCRITMTDEDVIRKAHDIAGVGNVHGPYIKEEHKPKWEWLVGRREDITSILTRLLPYMGERRTAKMQECLAILAKQGKGLPVGVQRVGNKYRASYRTKHLGMFDTVEEAKQAYEEARHNAASEQKKA
jgi:hypothetical protein